MKIFDLQPCKRREKYLNNIRNIASLSALFTSEVSAPFLVSRATENIYCESFKAINLGRDDSAIDAIIGTTGVGIKTFLHNNGNTLQKIAEFNKDSMHYRDSSPREKILIISRLRNKRLQFAMDNYGVDKLIYHCITRKPDGTIDFYETKMDFIDINAIKNVVIKQNSIFFGDGKNEYTFNLTKSTLFKRFHFTDEQSLVARIRVDIIAEPYSFIETAMTRIEESSVIQITSYPYIILPLYSFSNSRGKFVAEKSGLNQWNAGGRARNENEVYIPISAKIHKAFPDFFPSRDKKFELSLPNQNVFSVKVCQDNSKALMSDPNKALGEWILRDVLSLEEGTILTYEMLEEIGIDSVKIEKKNDELFVINFLELGSYDEFAIENDI